MTEPATVTLSADQLAAIVRAAASEKVYRILDNDTRQPTGQFYGVSCTGDLFESYTDGLTPENGWATISIPQADFASLIRNRAKRTRFNALTGEDLTAPAK